MRRTTAVAGLLLLGLCITNCVWSATTPTEKARQLLSASKITKSAFVETLYALRRMARPGTPKGDEALYLYAELCAGQSKANFLKQAKDAYSLLSQKGAPPWSQRAQVGLWRLLATQGPAQRHEVIEKLDRYIAEIGTEEASIDASYYLGGLYELENNQKAARDAYGHALKTLAYLGADGYRGLVETARIQAALDALKPRKRAKRPEPMGEPEATFQRAERLRKKGIRKDAIPLYQRVIAGWPKHDLGHLSGLRICQCRYEDKKIALSTELLKKFIAQEPNGPYRGHAHLLWGDILLEYYFQVRAAESQFQAILKQAAGPAHASWKKVLPDAHNRLGILAYFRERYAEAERHLAESIKLRPNLSFGPGAPAGMVELAEQVRAKAYPVPAWLRREGNERTRFVLFLGSAYMLGWKDKKAMALFRRVADGEFRGASFEQKAYALTKLAEGYMHLNKIEESNRVCLMFEKHPWSKSRQFAGRALLTYANNQSAHGDNKSANTYLEKVFTKYPACQDARWAFLCRCFHSYHHDTPQVALNWYREYLRRWPQSEDTERAKRYIYSCKEAVRKGLKCASPDFE